MSTAASPSETRVTLLGTGSPLPTAQHAGPATLVQAGDAVLLVDCGRAVVMRLAAAGVLPAGLSAVLLTHLHSDHITDLNDVITTHWIMSSGPAPLRVIGPPGTQQVVDGILAMLALDQEYRQAHHADLRHPMASRRHRGRSRLGPLGQRGPLSSSARPITGRSRRRSATGSSTRALRSRSAGMACPAPAWMSCAPAPTSTCRPSCGPT